MNDAGVPLVELSTGESKSQKSGAKYSQRHKLVVSQFCHKMPLNEEELDKENNFTEKPLKRSARAKKTRTNGRKTSKKKQQPASDPAKKTRQRGAPANVKLQFAKDIVKVGGVANVGKGKRHTLASVLAV
jgi:hypothetical protein